jgi:hypothetical protein
MVKLDSITYSFRIRPETAAGIAGHRFCVPVFNDFDSAEKPARHRSADRLLVYSKTIRQIVTYNDWFLQPGINGVRHRCLFAFQGAMLRGFGGISGSAATGRIPADLTVTGTRCG